MREPTSLRVFLLRVQLTICRYLTPSEVKERMEKYLKRGEKRPEGIRVQKGRMFFRDVKGQFIKVHSYD